MAPLRMAAVVSICTRCSSSQGWIVKWPAPESTHGPRPPGKGHPLNTRHPARFPHYFCLLPSSLLALPSSLSLSLSSLSAASACIFYLSLGLALLLLISILSSAPVPPLPSKSQHKNQNPSTQADASRVHPPSTLSLTPFVYSPLPLLPFDILCALPSRQKSPGLTRYSRRPVPAR